MVIRRCIPILLATSVEIACSGAAAKADSVGALDVSGRVQSQTLVRHPNAGDYHLIQQRSTLLLSSRWQLDESLLDRVTAGLLAEARCTLLYRAIYDSAYEYTPGFRERDLRGRTPSRLARRDLDDLPRRALDAVKRNHELREAYIDATFNAAPLRVRAGRQQIIWGESDFVRMLDRANPLDLSWHGAQELPPPAFGWDDLRIPLWMLRIWARLGRIGPVADVGLELYWNVGDWRPIKVAFLPRPWGIRLLDPLTNGEDGAFATLPGTDHLAYGTSLFKQGNYERTPLENSQIGLKVSADVPGGIRVGAYYFHQRWAGDDGTPFAPVHGIPDTATGRARTHDLIARGALPAAYVAPYVDTVGFSANYFDAHATFATYRFETVVDLALPLFDRRKQTTLSPFLPGVTTRDYWKFMLALDRATWLPRVNSASPVFFNVQAYVHRLLGSTETLAGPLDLPTAGRRPRPFCGSPSGEPCDDPFGNGSFRDDIHGWESLLSFAALSFYRSGTVVPVIGIVVDPVNSYAMNAFWSIDTVWSSSLTVNLTQRLFASMQDDLQKGPFDPWQVGTQRGRSETGLRITYTF